MSRFTLLVALSLIATAAVGGGTTFTLEDVNPDNSDHDPVDPDGATGGRVNGTAVSPTSALVLYAASEWGGLYKSTDGGDNWSRLDGHRPVATWDVEVDHSNANKVYATSFYDGRSTALSGINVSSNAGTSWSRPATAIPPALFCNDSDDQTELTAFGIDVDPTNAARVYVGTACGMAFTTDSGATWSYSSPVAGARKIWDVVVSGSGSFVDTCGDDGHRFYVVATGMWGTGGGLPAGRCSITGQPYDATATNLFAVVGTTIYETVDGGTNWFATRTNLTPQGRIPFVETNIRSTAPAGTKFDLWFGDVSLFSVECDATLPPGAFACGSGNVPAWSPAYTRNVGGHDDMGSILFDPTAANDACPILMSSDGGVYRNTENTSPGCQSPSWEQPSVTPHGLWPFAMSGANRAGDTAEDLYFGNQDNGVFGSTDAGATSPTWTNEICCDGFDTAADDEGVGEIIYSVCCFGGGGRSTVFFKKDAGFAGGGQINNYPSGGLPPGFKFPDSIVNWDDKKYAMITRNCTPGSGGCPGADGGVFITQDADAGSIVWTELGNATEPPTAGSTGVCGIKAATVAGVPTFYVQTGFCNANSTSDRMFKFTGTNPASAWTEIFLPSGGFGIFDVDASDPDRLLASGFTATDAFMYMSTNGGANWTALTDLDDLMDGNGDFPMKNNAGPTDFTGTSGYRQPSLVALDPTDANILVAGGRDSGIFVSTDAGANWELITDPRTSHTSGTPHIPRPRYAYFDSEPGDSKSIFIGSQGRGIWRIGLESGSCPGSLVLDNNTIDGGTESFGAVNLITTGPIFVVTATGIAELTVGTSGTVSMLDGSEISGGLSVSTSASPCS